MRLFVTIIVVLFVIASCGIERKISKLADEEVYSNKTLSVATVGISIFDPATNKFWYGHNNDKYFVPASNTKIPTCYAAMKFLGDSLIAGWVREEDTATFIIPSGDPSFLHADYRMHPLFNYLKKRNKPVYVSGRNWKDDGLGSGWAWNDFNEYYMAERSPMPVYGNILKWIQEKEDPSRPAIIYSLPEINWPIEFNPDPYTKNFNVQRSLNANIYTLTEGKEKYKEQEVPFFTNGLDATVELLRDTLGLKVEQAKFYMNKNYRAIHSQPLDSVLKPMMHRSDNFFAEQMLMMIGQQLIGEMNDSKTTDTLLKTIYADLPQKPRWADGSGLSRYNLFSPDDIVIILNRMKTDFGMDRIRNIFATGGEGTILNYYKADSSFIYGKTGTLSGVVAFSGFMYTVKGRLLIFSTIVNNHNGSAVEVRRTIEKFLQQIRRTY